MNSPVSLFPGHPYWELGSGVQGYPKQDEDRDMTKLRDTDAGDGGAPDLRLIAGGRGTGKLTAKQQGFVNSILAGANQVTAYKENYSTDGMADKTCWEAASRLFANSKVSARIKAGQRRQEEAAVHTGASLRLHVERELFELSTKAESDQVRLRALELIGKTEKCGIFLERKAEVADDLSPEEVLEQLEVKLKAAFEKIA